MKIRRNGRGVIVDREFPRIGQRLVWTCPLQRRFRFVSARSRIVWCRLAVLGVVIDGTKALVGTTGKFCVPGQSPECFTNTDPAAVFSSGKSFASLWTAAVAAGPTTYSPTPCVEIAGKWYIYSASQ